MAKSKNKDFSTDPLLGAVPNPMLDPDVSDDERDAFMRSTSEYKEYIVHRDGTIINGELLNQGDYVTLHPDVAKAHTDADVRLTEVKSAA